MSIGKENKDLIDSIDYRETNTDKFIQDFERTFNAKVDKDTADIKFKNGAEGVEHFNKISDTVNGLFEDIANHDFGDRMNMTIGNLTMKRTVKESIEYAKNINDKIFGDLSDNFVKIQTAIEKNKTATALDVDSDVADSIINANASILAQSRIGRELTKVYAADDSAIPHSPVELTKAWQTKMRELKKDLQTEIANKVPYAQMSLDSKRLLRIPTRTDLVVDVKSTNPKFDFKKIETLIMRPITGRVDKHISNLNSSALLRIFFCY